ncbi:ribosome modulation factor [Rhizobium sp. RAF36]|uniref:ribosome modulation factor n=1 Tax=Rhizobium sp. RAF36 TaxID=3233055 RepID=UPI003F9C0C0F
MCLLREVEEAEQQGRDLARSGGLASSNPYADRLDLHSAWLRGYRSAWATVIVPAVAGGAEGDHPGQKLAPAR